MIMYTDFKDSTDDPDSEWTRIRKTKYSNSLRQVSDWPNLGHYAKKKHNNQIGNSDKAT